MTATLVRQNRSTRRKGKREKNLDRKDRQAIREELKKHSHPLKQSGEKLVNIVNGGVASEKVNVQDALPIGEKMASEFTNKLPQGFYQPLSKQVVTMETLKKGMKIGNKMVYDMESYTMVGCW